MTTQFSKAEAESLSQAIAKAAANSATSYTRKYRSLDVAKEAATVYDAKHAVVPLENGEAILVVDLSCAPGEKTDVFMLICLQCKKKTTHKVGKTSQIGECLECARKQRLSDDYIRRLWETVQ